MRLSTPPLEIDDQIPYKNDVLNREQFGEQLINLITRTKEELVICLDAPWGEGKTTFVRMWQGHLLKKQIQSIYFDAFANDYIDNAFIAIASEIVALVEKKFDVGSPPRTKLSDFKKKASKIGAQLLPWAAKLGIRAATLNVIKDSDIEELIDIKDDIAKSTSNIVSKFIEDRISEHAQEIENVESYKKALEQLAKQISEDTGNPLVIIIDELDRCKPTYAVSVIERIKHLFSVKNIVFLLVMHKKQLEEAIKCIYGMNIDATSYIQKFISIDCILPKNTETQQINDYKKYCKRLYDLHELKFVKDESQLLDSLSILAREFDLSLRQLEKTFTYISIFYASVSERFLKLTPIICFLSIMKVIKPEIYRGLKNRTLSFEDLKENLNIQEATGNGAEIRKFSRLLFWMKYCLFSDEEYKTSDLLEEFNRIDSDVSFKYDIDRQRIIPLYCDIFDFVQLT